MATVFEDAIKRGRKKHNAKLRRQRAAERKKLEEKRKLEARQLKAARRWVKEKLPAIMEKAAAIGETSCGLAINGYGSCGLRLKEVGWVDSKILAAAAREEGLRTKTRFVEGHHDGDCGRLWDDHYEYYVVWD